MADATHAYAVFQGGYNDESVETWQFGVRFVLVNSVGAPADHGTLPTFGVDEVAVSRTEKDWTISATWKANLGIAESINVDDWLNDQLLPSAETFMGAANLSGKVELRSIKVSPINASGLVVEDRTAIGTYVTPPTGIRSDHLLPLQTSAVVSWVTPVIGRRGRGRIYLPPATTGEVDGDGLYLDTRQAGTLDGAVAFLEGCAITPTGGGNHWALPIVTGSPWTAYGIIGAVRVGNVLDTQRRRRRQLVETYVSAGVTYG